MKLDCKYIKDLIPHRDPKGHKGTFGSALLITGSYSMAGAAILSGSAANRSGCGLVKHILPKSVYGIVASNVIESVYYPIDDSLNGCVKLDEASSLIYSISDVDAILIGCGCKNTDETKQIVKDLVLNSRVPIVLDADGINAMTDCIDILKKSNCSVILTPHLKEFSRISGYSVAEISADRERIALDFAQRHHCTLVLKGHNTLIVSKDGTVFENTTGNCGMAKGGSGDVLAGILVSFLAQGLDAVNAACLSVYIHGLAGDMAARKGTEFSMTASDIVLNLGDAFQNILRD